MYIYNPELKFNEKILKEDIKYEEEKELLVLKEDLEKGLEIYTKILILQNKIYLLEKEKNIYKEIFKNKKELFSNGETNKNNVIEFSLKFMETEEELELTKIELEKEKNNLNELTNHNIEYPLLELKINYIEKENETELNLKNNEIEKKKIELEYLENSYFLPVIKLDSNYNVYSRNEKYTESFKETDNLYQAGITIQWDIFSGYSDSYKKNKVKLEIEKLKLEKENTENKLSKIKKELKNNIKQNELLELENKDKYKNTNNLFNANQLSKDEVLLEEIEFLEKNKRIYELKMSQLLKIKKLELGAY